MAIDFKVGDEVILLSDLEEKDTGKLLVEAGSRGTVKVIELSRKRASVHFETVQKEANAGLSAKGHEAWSSIEISEIRLSKGTFFVDLGDLALAPKTGKKQ